MDGIGFLVIGIVTALNFIFIKKKFEQKRYEDGTFDIILFVCILFLFDGSFAGMVVGMVASLIISIYFYVSPPKFIANFFNSVSTKGKPMSLPPLDFPDWDGRI